MRMVVSIYISVLVRLDLVHFLMIYVNWILTIYMLKFLWPCIILLALNMV